MYKNKQDLESEYEETLEKLDRYLSVEEDAVNDLDKLINVLSISDSLSTEDNIDTQLTLATEEINELSLKYFGVEEFTGTISLEELTGVSNNIISKFIKKLSNIYISITDLIEHLSAISKLLTDIDLSEVSRLKIEFENNERKAIDIKKIDRYDIRSLNKKLAIYHEMNKKFNVKSLIEHLDMPYDMIVNERIFNDVAEYVHDQLIVGRYDQFSVKDTNNNDLITDTKEEPIPVNEKSIKYLSKFNSYHIKKWLPKETKVGVIDRNFGTRFSIVSVYQDNKGARARHDFFKIDKSVYDIDIPTMTEKEMLELLKYGMELLDKTNGMSDMATSGFFLHTWENMKSNLMTTLYGNVFSIFAIKRVWRQFFIANTFYTGMVKAMIMQNRSFKSTPDVITELINKMSYKEK